MLLSAREQAEAEREMELLRQSLVKRQRKEILEQIRQAVQFLEGRNEIGRGLFTKGPESRPRESGYRYQHAPADLARAALFSPWYAYRLFRRHSGLTPAD